MVEPLNATKFEPLKKEEKRLTRNFGQELPGETRNFSLGKTPERKELLRKKSQYYDDAFAVRESNTSARERIHRESTVIAEIRTNVIVRPQAYPSAFILTYGIKVNDEYTFITDLSHNLSSRYQRPESSILVTLTHSICLLLGGSFDPAYTMTITSLPSQIQPVTNKRNTMLLAKLLEESLGVPPSRGLIKFVGVQEENFAFNGKTAAAEIEDLEKEHADNSTTTRQTLPRLGPKVATNQQSKRSMRNLKVNTVGANSTINSREPLSPSRVPPGRLTPPQSERGPSPQMPVTPLPLPDRFNTTPAIPMPPMPLKKTAMDRKAEKVHKIGHRKSFISGLFSRQSG
jgi:hypothetical protein